METIIIKLNKKDFEKIGKTDYTVREYAKIIIKKSKNRISFTRAINVLEKELKKISKTVKEKNWWDRTIKIFNAKVQEGLELSFPPVPEKNMTVKLLCYNYEQKKFQKIYIHCKPSEIAAKLLAAGYRKDVRNEIPDTELNRFLHHFSYTYHNRVQQAVKKGEVPTILHLSEVRVLINSQDQDDDMYVYMELYIENQYDEEELYKMEWDIVRQ